MKNLFHIHPTKIVRVWCGYLCGKFELLIDASMDVYNYPLEAAKLYSGQVLVIEEQNSDGTWPGPDKPYVVLVTRI